MRKPKPKSRENVLSPGEREKLLKAIRTEDEELAVRGLLFSGMRVDEFIHMAGCWIDWNKEVIQIPIKFKCGCYECLSKRGTCKFCKKERPCGYWHPKTFHGARAVPLLPETIGVFKRFFSKYGSVMDSLYNRVNIWRLVVEVGKRAGIPHAVFPHSLRSSFASLLADKEFDVFTIQAVMGWKKIDMAEQYVKMSGAAIKGRFRELW